MSLLKENSFCLYFFYVQQISYFFFKWRNLNPNNEKKRNREEKYYKTKVEKERRQYAVSIRGSSFNIYNEKVTLTTRSPRPAVEVTGGE